MQKLTELKNCTGTRQASAWKRICPALIMALLPIIPAHSASNREIALLEPAVVTAGSAHTAKVIVAPEWQDARLGLAPAEPRIMARQSAQHPLRFVTQLQNQVFAIDDTGQLLSTDTSLELSLRPVLPKQSWRRIFQNGTYLIGLDTSNTIHLLRSDPNKGIRITGDYAVHGTVSDMNAEGDRLAVLVDHRKIIVLDIGSARGLRQKAEYRLSSDADNLLLLGPTQFVVSGDSSVTTLAVDPDGDQLKRVSRYQLGQPVIDLAFGAPYLYVAAVKSGVTLFEVTRKLALSWVVSHHNLGSVQHIRLANQLLLATARDRDAVVMDVSRPELPEIVNRFHTARSIVDVQFTGNYAFLVEARDLVKVDFRMRPPVISNFDLDIGQGVNYGGQRRVDIKDNIAYVADWFSGIHIYDIGDIRKPRLLSSLHTPGSPKGIVVYNKFAYVADDDHGLQVLDVSDPGKPRLINNLPVPGLAYTPKRSGGRLYLASHRGGFQIIDIRSPEQPQLLGQVDTPGKAWSLDVNGNYAFIADDDSGLLIFDVTNAHNPKFIAQYQPGAQAEDVIVRGGLAYIAFFNDGLHIVDVRQPAYPRLLARLPTPGNARGIYLDKKELYIADWLAGVHIADIGDPAHPVIRTSYDTDGAAWGVRPVTHGLLVLDWWGGITVLNRTARDRLVLASNYNRDAIVRRLAAWDTYIVSANEAYGAQFFDIRNPLNPTWFTAIEPGCNVRSVAAEPGTAVLMCRRKLIIVDTGRPLQPKIVTTLQLSNEASQLRLQSRHILIGENGSNLEHIYYRPGDDDGPVRQKLPVRAHDFWLSGDRLFAATANQTLEVYQLDDSNLFKKKFDYELPAPISLVRAHDDIVSIVHPDNSIDVLELKNDSLVKKTVVNSAYTIDDAQIDDHSLWILDDHHGLRHYDIRAANHPYLESVYQAPLRATGFVIHDSVIYLSGEQLIGALSPLPPVSLTRNSKEQIMLRIPNSLPDGDYDLLVSGKNRQTVRVPMALTVRMPEFSKPKISPEEFKALERAEKAKRR